MKVDILREGFKNKTKKLVENSTKGADFSQRDKKTKNKHGLKALDFA